AARRTQEPAARHVDQSLDYHRIAIVGTTERNIAVGQSKRAPHQRLILVAAGAVEPDALVAAKGPQAKIAADGEMREGGLIAGKCDAGKVNPSARRGSTGCFHIRPESFGVAARFKTVEMREGMRTNLLARAIHDALDHGKPVPVRVG